MNLYGYGDGDPLNNADPFGLDCKKRAERDEKCEGGRGEDGIEEKHGRCEVAAILTSYIAALEEDPTRFASANDFPGEFDFKFGKTADDTYQVGDQWVRADEFGNFAAGYAGQRAFGVAGHAAMIAGGIAVASQSGSGEHWSDATSRPMINAGASRARADQRLKSKSLTNTKGCGQ